MLPSIFPFPVFFFLKKKQKFHLSYEEMRFLFVPLKMGISNSIPIVWANPSPDPMREYVKDIIAAVTESHFVVWKLGI